MSYKLADFDYNLPKELIAQQPKKPRDHSRLLVLNRQDGDFEHKYFYDLPKYLKAGDILVMNNSKVFPARLIGRRKGSGGKVEVFLHQRLDEASKRGDVWQCLVGGRRRKEGLEVEFDNDLKCQIIRNNQDGTFEVKFNKGKERFMETVYNIGQTPLPPYIKPTNKRNKKDRQDYQTVYADDNKIGSVAAPTAGFHFTKNLIEKIKSRGIGVEYITLHVGLGTFAPVKTNDITKHKMHAEYVEVKKSVWENIIKAKKQQRRVVAVGTTSVRTLEAVWQQAEKGENIKNGFQGMVNIFIYPGYKFMVVDAIITNFHLPKSTLLMLVSAFSSQEIIKRAYKEAINKHYRFYSYGDAMLIK